MRTKEEFFEYEKQKRKVFDDFYEERGWQCKRIFGKQNKDYDCEVLIDGKWIKVEEKYRSVDYRDFLIETNQDTKTNNEGWLYYCKADYIFYGVANKIYYIDLPKLREFINRVGDRFHKKISKKGWGITENLAIPWPVIIVNKIGERIK